MNSSLPFHLSQSQPQGLVQDQCVAQFQLGTQKNFVYLILDWKNRIAAWVDPQLDIDTPLRALSENRFELKAILLTHTHADHTAGVGPLRSRFPELPIHLHESDAHRLRQISQFHFLKDGDEVSIGEIQVRALHTPGHSAGELCYFMNTDRPYLFTGDTIFIRDCGRTDFPDGSNEQMFASIQRIKTLPPETVFLPGHFYAPECATTLARELVESPPFKCQSIQELSLLP